MSFLSVFHRYAASDYPFGMFMQFSTKRATSELIEHKEDHDRHDLAWNRYKMWRD